MFLSPLLNSLISCSTHPNKTPLRKYKFLYIWLSFLHWNVLDFSPLLDEPWLFEDEDSILLVRRISCAAESKRLRSKRTAGFVVIPLRFNDFLKKKIQNKKLNTWNTIVWLTQINGISLTLTVDYPWRFPKWYACEYHGQNGHCFPCYEQRKLHLAFQIDPQNSARYRCLVKLVVLRTTDSYNPYPTDLFEWKIGISQTIQFKLISLSPFHSIWFPIPNQMEK